jgi:predicted nucleotidyltransferase
MLAELSIDSQPVRVYLARPEDAILCKLAVGRKKDLVGLKQLVPKLKELRRIDRTYLHTLAKKFDLEKEVKLLEET